MFNNISVTLNDRFRSNQRIILLNHQFGRPVISSNFLEDNCRLELSQYGKFNAVVFRSIEILFWALRNGQQ